MREPDGQHTTAIGALLRRPDGADQPGARAGLEAVPCVVRDLDDRAAYMLLLLDNEQVGMSNLERGRHYRRSGMTLEEYAKHARVSIAQLSYDANAAEVHDAVLSQLKPDQAKVLRRDCTQHLCAVKAVPSWLWLPLVPPASTPCPAGCAR
jgi:hypothetical protein